jgi:hypothetical protein
MFKTDINDLKVSIEKTKSEIIQFIISKILIISSNKVNEDIVIISRECGNSNNLEISIQLLSEIPENKKDEYIEQLLISCKDVKINELKHFVEKTLKVYITNILK